MSLKRNLKTQVVISVFLVILGSTASAGRIIKVPLDFDNIQAAIDDANDGALSDAEIWALYGNSSQR
ncbi:MAG: hypothetical protein OEW48_11260 [Phycisphaerae bacterium]|nr:hypothetical protein [Phycisphaerae bacterium]